MTFVTRQRLLLGLAVLLMLGPTFLYAAGKIGGAVVFKGDTVKEMECKACGGLGKVLPTDKEASCPTCHGKGFAKYVIPGPNRPIQLLGSVVDAEGKPLADASIAITENGVEASPIVVHTSKEGNFGFRFPPGSFHLKVSHPTKKAVAEKDLTVEINAEPILSSSEEELHKIEETFTLAQ